MGVWPSMPGFVSAVNSGVTVSIGWTRLYYVSFLVGTTISALTFSALHYFFPAPCIKDYLLQAPPRRVVQAQFTAKWDGEEVTHYFDRPKEDQVAVEQFPRDV